MPKPLLTKTQIVELVKSGRAHECFTHSDPRIGTFDVTLMNKVAPFLYEPFTSDLTAELIAGIKATRDWEQERVNQLSAEDILFPTLWILDLSDHSHILIDGTHRMIASFERFKLAKFRGFMAVLENAIRPGNEVLLNEKHDWGRIAVRGGKLYNRETGEEIK